MRSTLFAMVSISFSVSPGATAAKTRTPRPIEETSSFSTVTDPDRTRCSIAAVKHELGLSHDYCCGMRPTFHCGEFMRMCGGEAVMNHRRTTKGIKAALLLI